MLSLAHFNMSTSVLFYVFFFFFLWNWIFKMTSLHSNNRCKYSSLWSIWLFNHFKLNFIYFIPINIMRNLSFNIKMLTFLRYLFWDVNYQSCDFLSTSFCAGKLFSFQFLTPQSPSARIRTSSPHTEVLGYPFLIHKTDRCDSQASEFQVFQGPVLTLKLFCYK